MKPNMKVVIVGRPNVGKSTLFNRLLGRGQTVVFDRPGVTRDLIEAEIQVEGHPVTVVDTAGWPYPSKEDPELSRQIDARVEKTLEQADMILWVVDGRDGRTSADEMFSGKLRSYRKKTVLIVNKIDQIEKPSTQWADSEFSGLAWTESVALTAKHGRGISTLLEIIEKKMESRPVSAPTTEEKEKLEFVVIGRPNVGKSTLINRILKTDRMLVADKAGTTHDAVSSPFTFQNQELIVVDTPGVRRRDRITDGLERTFSKVAIETGQKSDVALILMDVSQGLSEQDLKLLTMMWEEGITAVAVANKWDLVPGRTGEDAALLEREFRRRAHGAKDIPFVLISAKTGHGIGRLLETSIQCHAASHIRVPTSQLNRELREWNTELPSGLFHQKPGKLKYAVQTGVAPISFRIYVNDPANFRSDSYRYLENRFRLSFKIDGVPILIKLMKNK